MDYIRDLTIILNGEEYVLWYYADDYNIEDVHLTKLEDWEKLKEKYPDDMDNYYRFGGFTYSYEEIKESIEEDLKDE